MKLESYEGGMIMAAITLLAKSVYTFSRTCKSGVLCLYCEYYASIPPGPRESVHILLLVSSVSFSHKIYVYSWFIVLTQRLLTMRFAVSKIIDSVQRQIE